VDSIVISLDSSDKALELRNAASDGFPHEMRNEVLAGSEQAEKYASLKGNKEPFP
jgi:hypothetical protein